MNIHNYIIITAEIDRNVYKLALLLAIFTASRKKEPNVYQNNEYQLDIGKIDY